MNDCTACRKESATEEYSACEMPYLPEEMTLTMAYVPFQLDLSYYCPAEALGKGTLFTALNKPFRGRCT